VQVCRERAIIGGSLLTSRTRFRIGWLGVRGSKYTILVLGSHWWDATRRGSRRRSHAGGRPGDRRSPRSGSCRHESTRELRSCIEESANTHLTRAVLLCVFSYRKGSTLSFPKCKGIFNSSTHFGTKYGLIWFVYVGPRINLGLCSPPLSIWVGRSPSGPMHLAAGYIFLVNQYSIEKSLNN
jgi:hypothetical protein